jgi:hypothetical protein
MVWASISTALWDASGYDHIHVYEELLKRVGMPRRGEVLSIYSRVILEIGFCGACPFLRLSVCLYVKDIHWFEEFLRFLIRQYGGFRFPFNGSMKAVTAGGRTVRIG